MTCAELAAVGLAAGARNADIVLARHVLTAIAEGRGFAS